MTRLEKVYSAVQALPLPDRLRLVERVVHDAVEASDTASASIRESKPSMIGLFVEEPDLIDEVCRMAMEDRATRPLRASDG